MPNSEAEKDGGAGAFLPIAHLRPFGPGAVYNSALDDLEYRWGAGCSVSEPMDERVTILWNAERTRPIGIRIHGWSTFDAPLPGWIECQFPSPAPTDTKEDDKP